MSCPRHFEISAGIDDRLTPGEQRQLEIHLEECPICRNRLEELRLLRQRLRELPSPVIDLTAAMEERIRADSRPKRRPARWFGTGWAFPGFAVMSSLALGVWLGSLLEVGALTTVPSLATRVFDPVPPGGLCAAAELCRTPKGMQ